MAEEAEKRPYACTIYFLLLFCHSYFASLSGPLILFFTFLPLLSHPPPLPLLLLLFPQENLPLPEHMLKEADANDDGVLSNIEFWVASDPTNGDLATYVYDNFDWCVHAFIGGRGDGGLFCFQVSCTLSLFLLCIVKDFLRFLKRIYFR